MDKKLRLYEVFGEIGAKHVQESLKVSYVLRSSALHAARYVVCFRLGDRGRAKKHGKVDARTTRERDRREAKNSRFPHDFPSIQTLTLFD